MTDNTPSADNMQKYRNYREQFGRLRRALTEKFYLEALFIEYALIEDRTESILRHAGRYEAYQKSQRGRHDSLETKIKYIAKLAEEKASPLHQIFSDELFAQIMDWKEKRNQLVHALLKQSLTTESLAEAAEEGEALAKELRSRANRCSRALEKAKKE